VKPCHLKILLLLLQYKYISHYTNRYHCQFIYISYKVQHSS
jgi:hypothetical protein